MVQVSGARSKDPIGFQSGDTNLYRYVHNNPINLIDPSGLQECKKKNCYQVYLNCLTNFLIVPGLSNIITGTGDSFGFGYTATAWNYAGSKNLTYPLKSSIVRGYLAIGSKASVVGQLVALDAGLVYCLKEEWDCEFN